MTSKPTAVHLGPDLSPREGAVDAIYRFTQALDDADANLIRSAFTPDAVVDRSGLTPATGKPFPETKGMEHIVSRLLGMIGPMDTGHHVSNVRVKMDEGGKEAEVTCYVIAQHCRSGEGPDPRKTMHLAMGSQCRADVVREEKEGLWRISKIDLVNLWSDGDLGVFGM